MDVMRILIVDSNWHSMALAHHLDRTGYLITRTNDADEALHYMEFARQDAVIFNDDMPDMPLAEAMAASRDIGWKRPVFVLCSRRTTGSTADLLRAGADDVIAPDMDPPVLAARLRAAIRRSAGLSEPAFELAGLRIDMQNRIVSFRETPLALTRYEYEILETLALARGGYVQREALMTQLYAWDHEPSDKVLDVYFSRIRSKLRKSDAETDLIQTAWMQGYRLNCERGAAEAA